MIDLKDIYDHPAVILASASNSSERLLSETINPSLGEESRTLLFDQADATTVQDCINVLRLYERGKGVTFAALDNDTLAAVRESYEQARLENGTWSVPALMDLHGAVASLLGLDD